MSVSGFTPEMVAGILARDSYTCAMCLKRAQTANHRSDRGHGGYKSGNVLSNGVAICHICNGLIESDPKIAARARRLGVKISRYYDPELTPCFSPMFRLMVLFKNDGRVEFVDHGAIIKTEITKPSTEQGRSRVSDPTTVRTVQDV